MANLLRCYRHSGLVMYFSTLPAPSASAPCILAILTHLRVRVKICILTHPRFCRLRLLYDGGILRSVIAFPPRPAVMVGPCPPDGDVAPPLSLTIAQPPFSAQTCGSAAVIPSKQPCRYVQTANGRGGEAREPAAQNGEKHHFWDIFYHFLYLVWDFCCIFARTKTEPDVFFDCIQARFRYAG